MSTVHEDQPPTDDLSATRIADLEDENATLHRRLAALERELLGCSPTKAAKKAKVLVSTTQRDVLQPAPEMNGLLQHAVSAGGTDPFGEGKENAGGDGEGDILELGEMRLDASGLKDEGMAKGQKAIKTPGRKVRKLTPRTNLGGGLDGEGEWESP